MVDIALPYNLELRKYQRNLWNKAVHERINRIVAVWPRRNGKDLVSLNILIARAMQRVGLYFYMAPYYTQVKSIIWNGTDGTGRRFLDYIPSPLITDRNKADLRIELANGSSIRFVGSDNIDSIVGNNPVGIIFTEFSLHKAESWHYLRPVLAENGGWALFNGTPRGLNHMYQLYEMAIRDPENWYVEYLSRDTTGIPSLEAIEQDRKSGMPESLIQQEYYVSWTSSSEETLIPLDVIEPRLTTRLPNDYLQTLPLPPKVIGVDPAFAELGDRAVIARRQGRLLYPLEKYRGLDNMALATKVAVHINEWRPDAVFVDAGRGEGVISRLFQLGFEDVVFPVHFSGRPFSDLYQNKKAEIWCKMRDWVVNEDQPCLIPNDEELIHDMASPTFELNDRNLVQIESKKAMRRRGVKSTDCADAVALTFSEEIQESTTMDIAPYDVYRIPQRDREYDPLGFMNDSDYHAFN